MQILSESERRLWEERQEQLKLGQELVRLAKGPVWLGSGSSSMPGAGL